MINIERNVLDKYLYVKVVSAEAMRSEYGGN